jgi:hypothetical protein
MTLPDLDADDQPTLPVSFVKCEDCNRFAFPEGAVFVPSDEYAVLKAKASAADLGKLKNYRKLSRTRISRNPAYAEFIIDALPTMTPTEIMPLFEAKFGRGLISRSQLYRFAQDLGFARRRREPR